MTAWLTTSVCDHSKAWPSMVVRGSMYVTRGPLA
jgi:hypothetical protein